MQSWNPFLNAPFDPKEFWSKVVRHNDANEHAVKDPDAKTGAIAKGMSVFKGVEVFPSGLSCFLCLRKNMKSGSKRQIGFC